MINNTKGIPVPESGDDLLTAYAAGFNAAGVVIPATSIADARAMVSKAESEGNPPTNAHPWYFDVKGVLYKCTGYKGGNGIWDLQCMNQADTANNMVGPSVQGTHTRAVGQWKHLVSCEMQVKPYDRAYMAIGTAWIRVTAGVVDLELYNSSRDVSTQFKSRVNGADDGNTTVNGMGFIPAGVKPDISMYVAATRGAGVSPGPATFQLSADTWSRLLVMAWPISMA